MLSGIPDDWGPKYQYAGGAVTSTRADPNTIHLVAPAHMALIMFTPQPERQVALNSDHRIRGLAPVGSIEIVPASSDLFAQWLVAKRNLLVMLEPARVERLAGLEFDNAAFELYPPQLGSTDYRLHLLARQMHNDLCRPDLGRVEMLDSLVTVFSIYLLREYSSLRNTALKNHSGGLSAHTWRRLRDFMHAHLTESLPLERLASETSLSPSHFSRAFKQTVGQTPHQYLTALRLSHASHMLRETSNNIAKIANLSGFSGSSQMAAVMKRTWNISPSELRKRPGG